MNALIITAAYILTPSVLAAPEDLGSSSVRETIVVEETPAPTYRFSPTNLYPVWESNGMVLPHGGAYIGTNEAMIGIGGVVQIGLRPMLMPKRTPNMQVKVALLQSKRLDIAAQVSGYFVLPGAAEAFDSTRFTSGLKIDNTIAIVPVALAATFRPTSWLAVSSTTSTSYTGGRGPIRDRASLTEFVSAEVAAHAYHSLFLHAGAVDIGNDRGLYIGAASYRLHYGWFEGRLGYVYRFGKTGMQSHPLFSMGLTI